MLATMNKRSRVGALAGSVVALGMLAGCGAAEPAAPTPTASTEPAAVVEATPEQVASVLAEYEPEWREVIDAAGDCRFTWTIGGDTPTSQLEGMSCYTREQTIGITAQLVPRDWAALEIPSSMQGLVDDTTEVLSLISDVDLAAVCGADSVPANTPECTAAIGSRNVSYGLLESQLDAWKPYL